MQVTVWDYEGYDIAAPGSGDAYNFFAVVDLQKVSIEAKPIQIGLVHFQPGVDFTSLGNGKKTSSGYLGLTLEKGVAIRYVGIANGEYLLFRQVRNGKELIPQNRDLFGLICGKYQDIYITFRLLGQNEGCLFWLTGASGGRIIEL